MSALAARWRALPFAVRLAIVLLAGVSVLLLLRSWMAAAGITAGLLGGALLRAQGRRARAAADEARAAAADLQARARAADKRAQAKAAAAEVRRRTFGRDLGDDLDAAGDDAEARASRRLGL